MRITYDTSIRLAGIGMVPWGRLGPELWLPKYAVASLYGWDVPSGTPPQVISLASYVTPLPELPKINTPSLLRTAAFQAMLDDHLPGYDLLTYKPTDIPASLSGRKFLTAAPSYTTTIENKAVFREMFAGVLPFPAYRIVRRADLSADESAYQRLLAGRQRIIIQDEQLSGGKGSFFVDSYDSYSAAISALAKLSKHERVVVSDIVPSPREISMQCCVTRYGVFVGPVQQQIIAHPELVGQAVGGDKFCGVQIAAQDQGTQLSADAEMLCRRIGDRLQTDGYRGIFGVDFLLDPDQKLYVLEVNARITGATPLLTSLGDPLDDIPFYLLHLLELGDYEYSIDGQPTSFRREGSLLMLHTQSPALQQIMRMPPSGRYRLEDGVLRRTGDGVYLRGVQSGEFVLQEYMPPGMKIKPGGRLAVLQFPQVAVDAIGVMTDPVLEVVRAVRSAIQLADVPVTGGDLRRLCR